MAENGYDAYLTAAAAAAGSTIIPPGFIFIVQGFLLDPPLSKRQYRRYAAGDADAGLVSH